MHYCTLLVLAVTLGLSTVSAQDIDGDYPSACENACGPVSSQINQCDNQSNSDADELDCVCNASNMRNLVPQCQACIARNSNDPENLEDITEIINRCQFSTPTASGSLAAPTITIITTTYTETDDDGDTEVETDEIVATLSGSASPVFTTYTTTSTETDADDGDVDTDTDVVTSQIRTGGGPRSTVVTSTNSAGSTTVVTSSLTDSTQPNQTGGADSGSNNDNDSDANDSGSGSSSSGNLALATAVPVLGAGAGAIIAALVAL